MQCFIPDTLEKWLMNVFHSVLTVFGAGKLYKRPMTNDEPNPNAHRYNDSQIVAEKLLNTTWITSSTED